MTGTKQQMNRTGYGHFINHAKKISYIEVTGRNGIDKEGSTMTVIAGTKTIHMHIPQKTMYQYCLKMQYQQMQWTEAIGTTTDDDMGKANSTHRDIHGISTIPRGTHITVLCPD